MLGYLTPGARRRFILGGIPTWLTYSTLGFALLAFGALIFTVLQNVQSGPAVLPSYIVWLASLGAIGSVASIGMNALSVQEDATFDLTNPRLMSLRIALGALFAVVITLPFGHPGFETFLQDLETVAPPGSPPLKVSTDLAQAMLMLLPFVLGFSTSLVIQLLNRLVQAAQAFFGMTPAERSILPGAAPAKAPPPQVMSAPGQSQPI